MVGLTGRSEPPGLASPTLPPGMLLAARLLALYPLHPDRLGWVRPNPGVAAVPALDRLADVPGALWLVVALGYLGCVFALWIGRSVRAAAGLAGVIVLLDPVLDLAEYANNRLLAGLVLVLIGLYDPAMGRWPLRLQLSLLYAGAAINKVADADWRDGTFVGHWTGDVLDLRLYGAVGQAWSGVDRLVGWSTFLIEFGLAVLFVVESRTRWAIAGALGFHGGMLVFTEGRLSWLFAYVVGATLLAFTRPGRTWPYLVAAVTFWLLNAVVA